ncbi:MAG: DUF4129 domain-containing transglutaminase family protein [Candidatus Sumerlaeia bacterium]
MRVLRKVLDYDIRPRLILLVLIGIEAATIAFFSRTPWFAASMCALALIGLPGKIQFNPPSRIRRYLLYTLAIILVVKVMAISDRLFTQGRYSFDFRYSYAIAQFALVVQVAYFYLKHPAGRFPKWVIPLGVIAMVYAGNRMVNLTPGKYVISDRTIYGVFSVLFCIFAGIYLMLTIQSQKLPKKANLFYWNFSFLALAGALLIGFGVAIAFINVEQDLKDFASQVLYGTRFSRSQAGFSGRAWLGSVNRWKNYNDKKVAIRVFSRQKPGYMRIRAYNQYGLRRYGGWSESLDQQEILGDEIFPDFIDLDQKKKLFYTGKPENKGQNLNQLEQDYIHYTIQPLIKLDDSTPLVMDTKWIALNSPVISINDSGIIYLPKEAQDKESEIWALRFQRRESLTSATRATLLVLPRHLPEQIDDIAQTVFAGAETPLDKMRAAEKYFHENYEYSLDASYSREHGYRDPVSWFLIEKPAAHCEYFASATAILLRTQGIPTRYITGFVAAEYNPLGGYWIARNKDAHAWVEAYDTQKQRWVIVESTPSSGVPGAGQPVPPAGIGKIWDGIKVIALRMKTILIDQGILALLKYMGKALRAIPAVLPGFGFILVFPLFALVILLFLVRKKQKQRALQASGNGEINRLRQTFQFIDRQMSRAGIARHPSETPHRFAARVEVLEDSDLNPEKRKSIARWYRDYARVIYSGECPAETIQDLLDRAYSTIKNK